MGQSKETKSFLTIKIQRVIPQPDKTMAPSTCKYLDSASVIAKHAIPTRSAQLFQKMPLIFIWWKKVFITIQISENGTTLTSSKISSRLWRPIFQPRKTVRLKANQGKTRFNLKHPGSRVAQLLNFSLLDLKPTVLLRLVTVNLSRLSGLFLDVKLPISKSIQELPSSRSEKIGAATLTTVHPKSLKRSDKEWTKVLISILV